MFLFFLEECVREAVRADSLGAVEGLNKFP